MFVLVALQNEKEKYENAIRMIFNLFMSQKMHVYSENENAFLLMIWCMVLIAFLSIKVN